MNKKALVEIYVPATGETYDVFIPYASKMGEVVLLIAAAINDLSQGKFEAKHDAVLCDADTGTIYSAGRTVSELNITNGSRLMLI